MKCQSCTKGADSQLFFQTHIAAANSGYSAGAYGITANTGTHRIGKKKKKLRHFTLTTLYLCMCLSMSLYLSLHFSISAFHNPCLSLCTRFQGFSEALICWVFSNLREVTHLFSYPSAAAEKHSGTFIVLPGQHVLSQRAEQSRIFLPLLTLPNTMNGSSFYSVPILMGCQVRRLEGSLYQCFQHHFSATGEHYRHK